MQCCNPWKTWVSLIASIPLILPTWNSSALAGEPAPEKSTAFVSEMTMRPQDVVLQSGNVLVGRVLDFDGNPQTDAEVKAFVGNLEVARGVTDQAGEFAITVSRGGVCWLSSGNSSAVVRMWSVKASPPSAVGSATLAPRIIRGQSPESTPWYAGNGIFGLSTLGVAAFAGVATAIAVPIAVNQNNNNSRSNNQRNLLPASP